jgi:hypothetical protein
MLQGARFNAATYNLLSNNCNNFTNECAQFLVGTPIPNCMHLVKGSTQPACMLCCPLLTAHSTLDITSLPSDFLSTPLGAFIQPMLQQQFNAPGHLVPEVAQNHIQAPQQQAQQAATTTTKAITHPHERVALKALAANAPVTFASAAISKMLDKLSSFLNIDPASPSASALLSEQDCAVYGTMRTVLLDAYSSTPAKAYQMPAEIIRLLESIFAALPDAQAFPALDLLRILLLNRTINQQLAMNSMVTHTHTHTLSHDTVCL